jgi:hypothetical protein
VSDEAPQPVDTPARKPLGPLRLFFAIVGGLIMAVCGTCTLGVLPDALRSTGGGELHIDGPTVLVLGGVPTLIGLGILLLALKAGR